MSRFVGFKARFAKYDEAAADLAANLGIEYEADDLQDSDLYVDLDRVAVIMPSGEPLGTDTTIILADGIEVAVMSSPEEVLQLINAHVTQ